MHYCKQLMSARLSRAGHLWFAVLQCSSRSYFQAILAVKIIDLLPRPIKITNPKSNSIIRRCKK